MSFEAQNWASKVTVGDPIAKSILMCLANKACEEGTCYPGYGYLARVTEYDRRTIIRKIDLLCEKGLITKRGRKVNDGQTSNLYTLKIGSVTETPPSVTQTPPLVSDRHPPSVTQTPESSVNHQLKQNRLAKNANGRSKPRSIPWDNQQILRIAQEHGIDIGGLSTKDSREKIKTSLQGET